MGGMRFDLAVVGLGPAGRALASRALVHGGRVLVVDPRPEAVWSPTYGVWAEDLGSPPPGVIRSRVGRPELRSHGRHVLPREYAVLDNRALRDALPLEGAEVRDERVTDAQVVALQDEARVVVDARGARPDGRSADDPAPAQTAYGSVVPAADAAPALDGAEALLMDWSTDWVEDRGSAGSGAPTTTGRPATTRRPGTPARDGGKVRGPATFLYGIPLGDGTVLLEETCLAAAPGLPVDELRARLRRRLVRRGVEPAVVDDPVAREVVRIPMRGRGARPPRGVLAVGTGGRGGNVVTGYSVAHSLLTADPLARRLLTGPPPDRVDPAGPADLVREAGLRALLRLDVPGTLDLFDAFGRLPAARQRAFWSRESGAAQLAGAMWGMFVRMPARSRAELARATLGP